MNEFCCEKLRHLFYEHKMSDFQRFLEFKGWSFCPFCGASLKQSDRPMFNVVINDQIPAGELHIVSAGLRQVIKYKVEDAP